MKMRVPIVLVMLLMVVASAGYAQSCRTHHRRMLDLADRYFAANQTDSALVCYRRVVNNAGSGATEKVAALNQLGVICINKGSYLRAYQYLIDALSICESDGVNSYKPRIYNNMGNIYFHFKKFSLAKIYYRRALSLCGDSVSAGYYNNLGMALTELGETDSAIQCFRRSLYVCRRYGNDRLYALYNSMGSLYRKEQLYDSAFHYYRLSVEEARKRNKIEHEAQTLSDLGALYLQCGQPDSAVSYIVDSDRLATDNGFLKVMAENARMRSEIELQRGHTEDAFSYYRRYAGLRDSVFNVGTFGDISQLQRSYEEDKTNRHIRQLETEQREKERTIGVTLFILAIVSLVLLYIFLQNRRLNRAYSALVEKNLEIKRYEEREKESGKPVKSETSPGAPDPLFERIREAMEDTAMICQPDFSVGQLATVVKSNQTYVSRAIKGATDKSFRQFLNSYRIREAQRIFSEPDAGRYTIESVALRVGFKSRNTFHDVFKDIIGVSPNFYLKSLRERKNAD